METQPFINDVPIRETLEACEHMNEARNISEDNSLNHMLEDSNYEFILNDAILINDVIDLIYIINIRIMMETLRK